MDCQKMDLIESLQRSFFKVQKVRKLSNLGILLLFGNFLKNDLITLFCLVYSFLLVITVKRWNCCIKKVNFKVRQVRSGQFPHNYRYYAVCCCLLEFNVSLSQ